MAKTKTSRATPRKTKKSTPKTTLWSRLPFNRPVAAVVAFGLVCFGFVIYSSFAASSAIVGPDTSNYQSYLNAGTAYAQGYRFQIMKATEGLSFQDARFGGSLANAKKAGIIPGAYHFLHRGSASAQADYFIDYVKSHNGGSTKGVMYMLDVESYGSTYPLYSDVTTFVARFKQLVPNRTLILYTGGWFWGSRTQRGYLGNPPAPSGTVVDVSMYVTCTGSAWSIVNNCVTPQGAAGEPYAASPINGYPSYFFRQYSSQATFANLVTDANVTYKGITSLKALLGTSTPTPSPTPKPTPVAANTFIKSALPGKCLDNYHDSSVAKNKVDSYSCNQSSAQKWQMTGKLIKTSSGLCLNNNLGKNANGNTVNADTCNSSDPAEQWTVTGRAIKNDATGKCLDIPGASTANATALQIWDCWGPKQQQWLVTTNPGAVIEPTPSPTPKPTPASANPYACSTYPTLSQGAAGTCVKRAQWDLKQKGGANLTFDGDFGSSTYTALRTWQSKHGLTVDGVVGQKTWGTLEGKTITQAANPYACSSHPTLSQGSTGTCVKRLQWFLDQKMDAGLTIDGSYGSGTASQVRTWQTRHSLTADGAVGPQTWTTLEP